MVFRLSAVFREVTLFSDMLLCFWNVKFPEMLCFVCFCPCFFSEMFPFFCGRRYKLKQISWGQTSRRLQSKSLVESRLWRERGLDAKCMISESVHQPKRVEKHEKGNHALLHYNRSASVLVLVVMDPLQWNLRLYFPCRRSRSTWLWPDMIHVLFRSHG